MPSGGDGEAFSVRIVTGLGKSADDCVADKYLGGCIVARRSLHYIPHQTLYLPIDMSVVCRDIPCEATETCKNGHCVAASIADVASCTNPKGCDVGSGGGNGTAGTSPTVSSSGGAVAVIAGGTSGASNTSATGFAGSNATGGIAYAGSTASGGTTSTSSTATGGIAELGGTDQGGARAVGGASEAGGAHSPGGSQPFGGMIVTGGTVSAGGLTTGSGGASGGASAQSGSPSSGGSSTGGASVGGSSTGGAASGGVSLAGSTSLAGSGAIGAMSSIGGTGGSGTGGAAGATGVPAVCGDGILDPYAGEYCDTAGSSTTCNDNCTPRRCGDGVVNSSAGEQCDGSTASATCTPNCRISVCGDGYVDTSSGEQCEAGMNGCTACRQDVSGLANALRVSAVRDELLLSSLGLKLTISNSGPTVSTNGLTIRYYYTPDSGNKQTIDCTWSDVGCGNVSMSVKPLPKTCSNVTHYAEISVSANASLTSGSSFDVRGSITGGLLAFYNFGNDYSRPSGLLFPAETQAITLYQNGRLVWGIPPCGCGNGALDNGEVCDHSGESAACNADCTLAHCGDGKVNAIAGETCDGVVPSLTCNPECHSTGLPGTATSALLQWLDASQPASLQLSPRINVISDRSGKSNHVSQSILSKQPIWFPNAFGSLPAIFFDGVNHELAAASSVNDAGHGSIFIVHRVDPVGITATLVANGWFGSGGGFAVRTRAQLDGLGISLGASSGFATTQWTLGARSGNGPPTPRATYLAWEPPNFAWASGADSESLTASVTYASTSNPLALGGISTEEPYRGWIGELMLFDRMLSTSDRDAILTYLRQKWSVP